MTVQSTLNEVSAATEQLLVATSRELDAAKTAATHAERIAKFYRDALKSNARTLSETSHRADILAQRCAEQARMIAELLAKYEPAANYPEFPDSSIHPIHAAISVMQRKGVR